MSRSAPALAERLLRNPRVVSGALVLLLLLACALFAPWLAPHDPLEQDFLAPLQAPAWSAQAAPPETGRTPYWLGTDNLGRDVLSRLIWGARTAAIVAMAATLLAALAGTALGAAAGYFGGRVDAVVSRLVDVWMAFPPVLLAVVLVALLGTGLLSVIAAIAVVDWTRFARVVRAETQAQQALDYVTSARMLGLSPLRILATEVLPNVAPLLITLVTLEMGIAIVVEAILSFVGLSVASGASTWGGMLGEGRLYVHQAPSLMVLPVAATMLAVLGLNALGDGLRQELDPVLRA
ncbi:ABC transporter permease [Verminephrobacter eiseniae]|uniref:Binding-protein-dependent transport systems inner membrane component n=1 Tax=Verminephrobacter eiseniae (strain EF01-2) TaxID=391735 RepID=A1WJB5_VEREI|nr:ABC transporter permease [Verminephrobacter eiseniae]ABM57722.1 binding-protein-dependent transport systems inner membrane component [Verminephrobacter eiseniae EF01-2]MCW5234756.1 ABC transporter permease [Verminephrobacter eiseniae]MCW5262917.1 ABC transporter permease [Verminephrobacter eiseniae]MCW5283340.1 ABC transporter permease [Verminephrobacter eiseniae]MCW5293668.1 ABC transporter permease [Verminephrobacter eiseniae]